MARDQRDPIPPEPPKKRPAVAFLPVLRLAYDPSVLGEEEERRLLRMREVLSLIRCPECKSKLGTPHKKGCPYG